MANHPNRKRAAQKAAFEKMARAFNEWMRQYIANPEAFADENKIVGDFVRALNGGKTPDYGEQAAGTLMRIMGEIK